MAKGSSHALAILLAGAGPPRKGPPVRCSAGQLAATFGTLNSVPGIALRPFGLRLACDPTPWYAYPIQRHRPPLSELPSAELAPRH
jgi:hypothetical protein